MKSGAKHRRLQLRQEWHREFKRRNHEAKVENRFDAGGFRMPGAQPGHPNPKGVRTCSK